MPLDQADTASHTKFLIQEQKSKFQPLQLLLEVVRYFPRRRPELGVVRPAPLHCPDEPDCGGMLDGRVGGRVRPHLRELRPRPLHYLSLDDLVLLTW